MRRQNHDPNPPTDQTLYNLNPLLLLILGIQHCCVDGLDFLTVRDLAQLPCLCRALRNHLQTQGVEYTKCRDSNTYRVPFPGFPGLFSTRQDTRDGITRGLFPHQLASLSKMQHLENPSNNIQFGDLRGGALADAPGLGKTVTTLALIASTAGRRPIMPELQRNRQSETEDWSVLAQNPGYTGDVLMAMLPIRHLAHVDFRNGENVLVYPRHEGTLSLRQFACCRSFVRAVRRRLRNRVSTDALEIFANNMDTMMIKLDKTKRSFLISKTGKRYVLERSLFASTATLIVVPDALLEHWFEQTLHHLNLSHYTDGNDMSGDTVPRGVVYLDGIGDIAKASVPLTGQVRLDQDMPGAALLTGYLVVITTFSRCEREYRIESQTGRLSEMGEEYERRKRPRLGLATAIERPAVSPLLKIRWLRLVVDEGHELGGRNAESLGLTRVLHEIAAERRWILSGTPTTGNEDAKDYTSACLDQLQRLLCFLRHQKYGTVPSTLHEGRNGASAAAQSHIARRNVALQEWDRAVKKPFLEKWLSGREELLRVLKEIMVIHQKEHIHLPRPIFIQGEVSISVPQEIQARVLRAKAPGDAQDLLDRYLDSSEFQSMVDEAQANYIVNSIRQRRKERKENQGREGLESAINGLVVEYNSESAPATDFRPIKAVVYSSSQNVLLSVEEFLHRNLLSENIALMYSGDVGDMSMELSRFRQGFKQVLTCPICGGKSDATSRKKPHCRRTLVEVTIQRDGGDPVRVLIEPERVIRAVPPPLGNVSFGRMDDILHSQYWQAEKKWRSGDVLEIDIRDPHPILPKRQGMEVWEAYGSNDCIALAELYDYQGRDWFFGPLNVGASNGVFDPVEATLQKWQPCRSWHASSRWYKGPTFESAATLEKVKEDVFILCLNAEVSHGLDLSFVTHMYLLEPIEDAALLQQVTSRAHRLGATGPVTVETVNVWLEMDDSVKVATKVPDSGKNTNKGLGIGGAKRQTDKAVCVFCCRSFPSMGLAEEHERTTCLQNPDSTAKLESFSLASLYREIRPPAALLGNEGRLPSPNQ